MDDRLLVDISDALSERDRVRFTVHTRTKLPQFAKPVLSVVRQHEEFIWLHDCLVENDQYAGYIIPPPPPKPDFDSSREKLQRLGDCEANLTKEEFAKMKQELEAEYLAIFKKTVAMHEIFLQRLATHEKFREDGNFKIFLEYENELAVRGKSKREKLAGSIQNIGKSLTDFVITTSQVANSNSIGNLAIGSNNNINYTNNNVTHRGNTTPTSISSNSIQNMGNTLNRTDEIDVLNNNTQMNPNNNNDSGISGNNISNIDNGNNDDTVDEQYFEKERLFLALYYNSIRESSICSDKVTQAHKCVADSYLNMAHQLVRLASIEVVPITNQTRDSSSFVACPLPSLTLPTPASSDNKQRPSDGLSTSSLHQLPLNSSECPPSSSKRLELINDSRELGDDDDGGLAATTSDALNATKGAGLSSANYNDKNQGDNRLIVNNDKSTEAAAAAASQATTANKSTGGCANDHTSEGLKKLLLHVSDYFEQAKKIEARIASDEDLKLTDTLLYYKRDTVAAQDLLMRRMRFMSEYETATKNLEKARAKGRTATSYADVIQKQAKENFLSISKLAKQELINYKQRRVSSFKKAFHDLAELELKHLRSHSQLIKNCLNVCRGLASDQPAAQQPATAQQVRPGGRPPVQAPATSSGLQLKPAREIPSTLATTLAQDVQDELVGSALMRANNTPAGTTTASKTPPPAHSNPALSPPAASTTTTTTDTTTT